jgi:nitrogen regulatory protein PII
MKKITAYVNTVRVHWLVEELDNAGINEIMVTEYFSPSSKISRMELLAEDNVAEIVRAIIHRVGTTGESGDHAYFVEEHDPKLPGQIPLGKRTSKLEESRIKQLISFMLRRSHQTITSAFLVITLSILAVTVFIGLQTDRFRQSASASMGDVRLLLEKTNAAESAALEEMLAVERFHRGESMPALRDYQKARVKLSGAIRLLEGTNTTTRASVNYLGNLQQRFHSIADGMFSTLDSLSRYTNLKHHQGISGLTSSHNQMMASLDSLRIEMLTGLSLLQQEAQELGNAKQEEMNSQIEGVKLSLLLLAAAAIAITSMIWIMIERNVSRPISKLVEEARTIDTHIIQ